MNTPSFAEKWRLQYNHWRNGSQLESTRRTGPSRWRGCNHCCQDNLQVWGFECAYVRMCVGVGALCVCVCMCMWACVCPCVCGRVRTRAHVFVCEINMYYMCEWYYWPAPDSLTEGESELHINCLQLKAAFFVFFFFFFLGCLFSFWWTIVQHTSTLKTPQAAWEQYLRHVCVPLSQIVPLIHWSVKVAHDSPTLSSVWIKQPWLMHRNCSYT